MKVIALSEGAFTIDSTKQFVPFDLNNDELNTRPKGSLLVEIQPFVVITDHDIILLDTGLGYAPQENKLQIFDSLHLNGINPGSITKVLLSHLHKDHAGGISIKNNAHEPRILTFKNATYYINKNELEHAFLQEGSSYKREELDILKTSGQVHLLDDSGNIDGYITYESTGGHSKFHQVFWIRENNEIIFYGGDVAPQLQQMRSRFIAKYDFDGKKSMELRRKWLEKGTAEKWTFLFYHDIKNPIHNFN